jgi:hypothetical protein
MQAHSIYSPIPAAKSGAAGQSEDGAQEITFIGKTAQHTAMQHMMHLHCRLNAA